VSLATIPVRSDLGLLVDNRVLGAKDWPIIFVVMMTVLSAIL
jgi:hypothetical protein